MNEGTRLREIANTLRIPERTVAQVRDALASAKKSHADMDMAYLMLRHGRLTSEARNYVNKYYSA